MNREEIAPGAELLDGLMGVRFPTASEQDEDLDFAACRFRNFSQDQCDGANRRAARPINTATPASDGASRAILSSVGVPTGIVNPNRKHRPESRQPNPAQSRFDLVLLNLKLARDQARQEPLAL